MLIPLERRGAKPVFRQIVDYLRQAIEAGRLEPGTKLEPIRVLAQQLGVNRETVADAYRELESLGLTESTVGRGTFVLARSVDRRPAAPAPRPFVPILARAIEAAASRPVIDYSAAPDAVRLEGIPGCPAFFPVEDFRKAINQVMQRDGRSLLEYGDSKGYLALRRVLVDRLARVGIQTDVDDVVITGGSTQGVAIAARLFCDPGDAVVVESPSYPGAATIFLAAGLRLAPVPMGPAGLDLDALDTLLARGGVRLVYTMPSFHNPLGISTSLDHRRRLLEITARHGVPVLEDDFEHDLRVRGRAAPPLKALDRTGNVVYVSTFSKVLFPGVRVGWLVADRRVSEAATVLNRALDLASSPVLQAALAQFCRVGGYDRHVKRITREIERRFTAAEAALARHLPEGTTFTRPEGGFVVWVTLPAAIDTLAMLPAARAAGVVYAPGQTFFADGRRSSALRFSVAQASVDEIERGVRALGEVVRAELPRGRVARTLREETRIHV
jgi:GntR family transcriptional regulator/MocR family aminotransferase